MGLGLHNEPEQEGLRSLLFLDATWTIVEDALDTISFRLIPLSVRAGLLPASAIVSYIKVRKFCESRPKLPEMNSTDRQMVSIALTHSRFFKDELHNQPGVNETSYLCARHDLQYMFATEIPHDAEEQHALV